MGGQVGRRRQPLPAVLLAGLLFVGALAACGGSTGGATDNSPGSTPKQGGTYNYPLSAYPLAFDPAIYPWEGTVVLHQLYEGLVRYAEQPDGTLKTSPCLAESWSGNADATVWTFKLRRGVMFQEPVSREATAADVVADVRYLADPAHECQFSYMFAPIKGANDDGYASPGRLGVQAIDRYTVRFTLKYPFSEFPDTLGNPAFWVWPADYLRKVGVKAYSRHPVGTGPYLFQRSTPGTSIDLVRNPQWWDTSGGPYIDTIHYEVFSSISSMMLAFQKGLLDWTFVPNSQVASSRSLPRVTSGDWQAVSTPRLNQTYLGMNMNNPLVGGQQGLPLRQALTYGCDRQAAIDAASDGVYLVPTGLVPPGVPGSQKVTEPYAHDPAKAAELLKQTGPVTLDLIYPSDPFRKALVETLTASYAKIGITIKPRGIAWNVYQSPESPIVSPGNKLQLFLFGWMADYPSMDNFLSPLFESDSGPFGAGFYSNPQVDDLLSRARATPDQQARIQLYAEAEQKILADAPVIPLVVYADYRLTNSRVANVKFNSMGWADLWRAWVR